MVLSGSWDTTDSPQREKLDSRPHKVCFPRLLERFMTVHLLNRKQIIPGNISDVFEFFENPLNLEKITPPWLRFRVLSSTDSRVGLGTKISYRLHWQIFPLSWNSEISEYKKDIFFADEMTRGPYRSWYHRHLFRSVQDNVEMTDTIQYSLPLGLIGNLVHAVIIKQQLESIFDYRKKVIEEIFGANSTGRYPI